jgi:hypothetical protein
MVSTARAPDSQSMVIRFRLGTGWETTVDDLIREVWLRFKLLGLALPVKKRIPFSEVAHVAVVCRESWWSRGIEGTWILHGAWGPGTRVERTPMPTKGWRYDLLLTERGGRTYKIETLKSLHTANELAGRLRRRLGLPSAN